MPELPEVETIKLGLQPLITKKTIVEVELRRPDLRWPFPEKMASRLEGSIIKNVQRRSKYLLLELNNGITLIIHFGMSGRFSIFNDDQCLASGLANFKFGFHKLEKHDHVVIRLSHGLKLVFNDPRRFGAMDLFCTNRIKKHRWLANLGVEPLGNEFTPEILFKSLSRSKTSIKSALMDQKLISGMGNIYVLEALWCSGVSPLRIANSIREEEVENIVSCIRRVLRNAIRLGGTSLQDFRNVGGDLGYFQNELKVYGREKKSCLKNNCKGKVNSVKQGGRTTYYCNLCQK